MIVNSYTVINPRTVVIVTLNTSIADITMARSERPDDFTVRAEQCRVENH